MKDKKLETVLDEKDEISGASEKTSFFSKAGQKLRTRIGKYSTELQRSKLSDKLLNKLEMLPKYTALLGAPLFTGIAGVYLGNALYYARSVVATPPGYICTAGNESCLQLAQTNALGGIAYLALVAFDLMFYGYEAQKDWGRGKKYRQLKITDF